VQSPVAVEKLTRQKMAENTLRFVSQGVSNPGQMNHFDFCSN